MGNLKTDTAYIYENSDGVIYAREFGAPVSSRKIIGYDSHTYDHKRQLMQLMPQVLDMCDRDPVMKQLLEQLLIMYNLKKTNHE